MKEDQEKIGWLVVNYNSNLILLVNIILNCYNPNQCCDTQIVMKPTHSNLFN